MVKHQIITGAVTNQHVTVAVQNLTTGGLDAGNGGKVFGVIDIAAGFDDLLIIQLQRKETDDDAEQKQENACSDAGYSFHDSPPILPIERKTGYSKGITATLMAPVRQKYTKRSPMVVCRSSPVTKTSNS